MINKETKIIKSVIGRIEKLEGEEREAAAEVKQIRDTQRAAAMAAAKTEFDRIVQEAQAKAEVEAAKSSRLFKVRGCPPAARRSPSARPRLAPPVAAHPRRLPLVSAPRDRAPCGSGMRRHERSASNGARPAAAARS